ncbi:hypothetical protein HDV05_001918, partial [Chytridiales sp. JEL 0842]
MAARNNHAVCLRALIEAGADPNWKGKMAVKLATEGTRGMLELALEGKKEKGFLRRIIRKFSSKNLKSEEKKHVDGEATDDRETANKPQQEDDKPKVENVGRMPNTISPASVKEGKDVEEAVEVHEIIPEQQPKAELGAVSEVINQISEIVEAVEVAPKADNVDINDAVEETQVDPPVEAGMPLQPTEPAQSTPTQIIESIGSKRVTETPSLPAADNPPLQGVHENESPDSGIALSLPDRKKSLLSTVAMEAAELQRRKSMAEEKVKAEAVVQGIVVDEKNVNGRVANVIAENGQSLVQGEEIVILGEQRMAQEANVISPGSMVAEQKSVVEEVVSPVSSSGEPKSPVSFTDQNEIKADEDDPMAPLNELLGSLPPEMVLHILSELQIDPTTISPSTAPT